MHFDAKSNHIFFISNFYAFRLFIDYWESTVQFKCRVPLFDPGIELMRLSQALCEKRPQYEQRHEKVILEHDNARPHVAKPVETYLQTLKWSRRIP